MNKTRRNKTRRTRNRGGSVSSLGQPITSSCGKNVYYRR